MHLLNLAALDTTGDDSNGIIDRTSFGSNQIIRKIGRDRSHISRAIQFLIKNKLLEVGSRWKQGKIKDIRITKLGIEIAKISKLAEEYDTLFSKSGSEETAKESIEARKRKEEGVLSSKVEAGPDYQALLDATIQGLRAIRRRELNSFLHISNVLIALCMLVTTKYTVKSDVKGIMEEIVIGFIRNRFRNMLITNSAHLSVNVRKAASEDVLSLIDGLFASYKQSVKAEREELKNKYLE
jgi:hypothetical protein